VEPHSADPVNGYVRPEIKKRMDRLPFDIQRGDAGGRQDNQILACPLAVKKKKGGFPGPRPPGDKKMFFFILDALKQRNEILGVYGIRQSVFHKALSLQ